MTWSMLGLADSSLLIQAAAARTIRVTWLELYEPGLSCGSSSSPVASSRCRSGLARLEVLSIPGYVHDHLQRSSRCKKQRQDCPESETAFKLQREDVGVWKSEGHGIPSEVCKEAKEMR
eukprot:TRINITY_DN10052_c0_g1_i1.p3 TRINITY_DN10052_c0_g1~~TRINITY_DN10052_c0_g1_i1.p3  ORF type:complete len:119 (-),score=17.28 TRINITY_DN10052_c0_g1_i1:22-378(-)